MLCIADEAGIICAQEDSKEGSKWGVRGCGACDYAVEVGEETTGGCIATVWIDYLNCRQILFASAAYLAWPA